MNCTISKILSISNNYKHNHKPTTDHNLAVKSIRNAIKRKAEVVLHARPNKIIYKRIQETDPIIKEVIIHNDIN